MATDDLKSVDDLLDFAIIREQEAHDFYVDLAERTQTPAMKGQFIQYAKEELGHKKRLEGIKAGKRGFSDQQRVLDLKISDYLVDVEVKDNMDYQEALILAMKREKAAYKLYSDLSQIADTDELKEVFRALAQEEANHKLRFEIEYDNVVYREN